MGLDMWVYATEKKLQGIEVQTQEGWDDEDEEIAYFRKFNALHGLMQDLYESRGGEDSTFNCVPFVITPEDIAEMLRKFKDGEAQPVEGFFFGQQVIQDYDIEKLEALYEKMLELRELNYNFYYYAWY